MITVIIIAVIITLYNNDNGYNNNSNYDNTI